MELCAVSAGACQAALRRAAAALKACRLRDARAQIALAMRCDMDASGPHNLLGILCEMEGDDDRARRHYRAAYALDPTDKACCRNLERLVLGGAWEPVSRRYDFGGIEAAGEASEFSGLGK